MVRERKIEEMGRIKEAYLLAKSQGKIRTRTITLEIDDNNNKRYIENVKFKK